MEQTKQKLTSVVSIKDLIEAGAHFGHQKRKWNPKMKRFIFEERGGIFIIDLAKTMQQLRNAIEVIKEAVEEHKTILFVGTKKQAKSVIKDAAEKCGEFYVSERWLGGMLTNLTTIRQSVKTLEQIEKRIASGGEGFTKKEMTLLSKEREKLDQNLAGIRAMRKPPGLIVIVDPSKEHIAVKEATKLGIPVMALVDTNCDPDPIDYIIACNDDALKSIQLIIQALAHAVVEKKKERGIAIEKKESSDEFESHETDLPTEEEEEKE